MDSGPEIVPDDLSYEIYKYVIAVLFFYIFKNFSNICSPNKGILYSKFEIKCIICFLFLFNLVNGLHAKETSSYVWELIIDKSHLWQGHIHQTLVWIL